MSSGSLHDLELQDIPNPDQFCQRISSAEQALCNKHRENVPIQAIAIQEIDSIICEILTVCSGCSYITTNPLGGSAIVWESPTSNADPDFEIGIELFRIYGYLEEIG